jgi:hypothetical protein
MGFIRRYILVCDVWNCVVQSKNRHKQLASALTNVPSAPAIDKLHQTLLTSRTGGRPEYLSYNIRQYKILSSEHEVLRIISEPKRSEVAGSKIRRLMIRIRYQTRLIL